MKFDPRRASRKPPKNRDPNRPWDLRTYKVRKNQFQNVDLRGKDISKKVLQIFGEGGTSRWETGYVRMFLILRADLCKNLAGSF